MAARRERERRRPPADRRYQFGAPDAAPETDLDTDEATLVNGEDVAQSHVAEPPRRAARPPREPEAARAGSHPHLPFTAYRAEYTYVLSDLRRVALVIGSLLVILILLYFVLPR
jgi:hypothetical protein